MLKIRVNNKFNCFEYTKLIIFVKQKKEQEKGLEKRFPNLNNSFFHKSAMSTGSINIFDQRIFPMPRFAKPINNKRQ